MNNIAHLLSGGDLRSIGKSNTLLSHIKTQDDFDQLFQFLFHKDRLVVMRSADVIEKITVTHSEYLQKHKRDILQLTATAQNKELQWHLALLLPRLPLTEEEFTSSWHILKAWLSDQSSSRIVRVNALQGLFEWSRHRKALTRELETIMDALEKEDIPSLNARIKRIRKQMG